MKFAPTILATLALLGCSQEDVYRLPTAPAPPVTSASPAPTASSLTSLWGMVVDGTGMCIVGASVQVVRGHGLGQSITQTTPCDAWAYDGGVVFGIDSWRGDDPSFVCIGLYCAGEDHRSIIGATDGSPLCAVPSSISRLK